MKHTKEYNNETSGLQSSNNYQATYNISGDVLHIRDINILIFLSPITIVTLTQFFPQTVNIINVQEISNNRMLKYQPSSFAEKTMRVLGNKLFAQAIAEREKVLQVGDT